MTIVFFGESWNAPILTDAMHVATPVGQSCYGCGEQIEADDRGFIQAVVGLDAGTQTATADPVHAECDLRAVMGHMVGICPCNGYDSDRAAAKLVWQRVGEQRGRDLATMKEMSMRDSDLPTREQMFVKAVGELDVAYRALGDAQDWLRSDWQPVGSVLTDVQGEARTEMAAAIAEAKNVINRAKDAGYRGSASPTKQDQHEEADRA